MEEKTYHWCCLKASALRLPGVLPAMPAYAVDAGAAGKTLTDRAVMKKPGRYPLRLMRSWRRISADDEPLENDLEKQRLPPMQSWRRS